jgi:hypothetical protein
MLTHPLAERLRGLGMAAMADAFLEMQSNATAADLAREDWLGLGHPHFDPIAGARVGNGRSPGNQAAGS